MNPWLYVFLISLTLFLLLFDIHTLKQNLWAGFVCIAYQTGLELVFNKENFMHFLRVGEGLPKSIVFSNTINIFYIGIVFTMGILFVQFLPRNYILQIAHASIWLFYFRLMSYIAQQNNMIEFVYWNAWKYIHIVPGNMLALAWLKNIISGRDIKEKDEAIGRNFIK